MRYLTTAIDNRGRLGDRSLLRALAWGPQRGLEISVAPGMAILRPREGGIELITSQERLRVPPLIRRGLGLAAGQRVLLVADPKRDQLVIFAPSAVEAMTEAYRVSVAGVEGR